MGTILLIANNIHSLKNVVIVDLICADFVSQVVFFED
jgi:hypothetical protein